MPKLYLENGEVKEVESFRVSLVMDVKAGSHEEHTLFRINANLEDIGHHILKTTGLKENVEYEGLFGDISVNTTPVVKEETA